MKTVIFTFMAEFEVDKDMSDAELEEQLVKDLEYCQGLRESLAPNLHIKLSWVRRI